MDANKKFFQQGRSGAPEPAGPANNEIWYTSSDGNIVTPYSTSALPTIVSNTYSDGKGIIKFKTDVISIGRSAFRDCNSLTSVTIPNSVAGIAPGAFFYCTGLTSIICKATTPPKTGLNIFSSIDNGTIYVPVDSVDDYKTSWPPYADRIQTIPE